ncbi:hypothetical protein ACFLVR_01335 [Chloroflexota bacterium]
MPEEHLQEELALDAKKQDCLFSIGGPVKATNEYVWAIDGNVLDLPQHECSGSLDTSKKPFKRHLKSPDESAAQYIERVICTFTLYIGDPDDNGHCPMWTTKRGLCFCFTLIPREMKVKSQKSTIFASTPDNPQPVVVEGAIATHHKLVKFISFLKQGYCDILEGMSRIALPKSIRFVHE